MKSFRHFDAESVKEAISLLKEHEGRASLIAGGTDLLGTLKDEILLEYPEAIINIKTIPGLAGIKEDVQGLNIGALTRLDHIARSSVLKDRYQLISEAAEAVASPEIRNMGTIGGNLCQDTRCWYYRYPHQMGGRIICHRKGKGGCQALKGDNRYHAIIGGKVCFAVCPSDIAIALTALDADIRITGPDGEREVPIQDFFHSLGTARKPDEILTEIQVPRPPESAKQTFLKFSLRKPIDFAIVSVASVISSENGVCTNASIALGAVAPSPIRATKAEEAIKGKIIDAAIAEEAAEAAVSDAKPLSMNEYKIEITKTLIKRAIVM